MKFTLCDNWNIHTNTIQDGMDVNTNLSAGKKRGLVATRANRIENGTQPVQQFL